MLRHGETLVRTLPGLYGGQDVRAEREGLGERGHWRFQMRLRYISEAVAPFWYEPHPDGLWQSIGTWPTLDRGMFAASLLRAGTHFWDASRMAVRPYSEAVFAALRGEIEDYDAN